DAAALDAVFGELPRGSDLVREDAAVRLLGLLGDVPVDSADRQLLVEVTLARVLRAQDRAGRILTRPEKPTLTEESAHALDALMEAPGEAVTDTAQAARVAALCELLDAGVLAPTEADRARLVGATLERIQSQLDQRQRRFRLSPEPGSATSGGRGMLRPADLVSIAAVFLIATAIAWPFLVSIREQARET